MKFEIYGDSIRAGFGLDDKPYTERIPGFIVENYAFNGASVFDVLELVYKKTNNEKNYALIGVGVNDLIWNREPKRIFERLMDIVTRLKELNKIILVESLLPIKKKYFLSLHNFTENELNEKIYLLNALLRAEAKKKDFLFIDYSFEDEPLSTRDGLHPDEYGSKQLEKQLIDFLKKEVIIRTPPFHDGSHRVGPGNLVVSQ